VSTNYMNVPDDLPSGSFLANDPYWTEYYSDDLGKNVFPGNVMPACPNEAVAETIAHREGHSVQAQSWSLYSSKNPTVVKNIGMRYNWVYDHPAGLEGTAPPISFAAEGPKTIRQRDTAHFVDPNTKPEGK